MAKTKEATAEVNKSEEIRKLLHEDPKAPAKVIQDALAKRGIQVASSQIYFIKGQTQGKKGPKAKATGGANDAAPKTEGSKSEAIRDVLTANPMMSAKEVQETLAKRDISVTGGLIYFVKGKMKGRKQRQEAKAKNSATKNSPSRKTEVNKSHEIRELLAENPEMPAKEIQEALAKRGITVSGHLIYLLKSKMHAKKRRQKREKVAQVVSSNGSGGDPVAVIHKVKSLASEVGGMKKLKALVEALSE